MPAGQAVSMLQQLMQQLMGGQMASQSMASLDAQGLGKVNAKKLFRTPEDEMGLRSAVLNQVLGRYYGGGGMSGGNPQGGGIQTMPFNPQQGGLPDITTRGPMDQTIHRGGPILDTNPNYSVAGDQGGIYKGGDPNYIPTGPPQMQGGMLPDLTTYGQPNPNMAPDAFSGQGYQPFQGGAQSVDQMIQQIWDQQQGQRGINPGQGGPPQLGGGVQYGPGMGLPGLDPNTQNQINSIYQPQMDQMNLDFEQQKQGLLQNLFGRGMQASTAATDAGGKLLYGRSSAMNQIQGQKAQAELEQRNKIMDLMSKAGGLGGAGGGGFGGSVGGYVPPNMFGGGTADSAISSSIMQQMQGMDRPMNFEQAMQMKQLQLQRDQLSQQGALGFGGLGLQRELGLGSQGLQGQGLEQDFLSQLLGMGQARQSSQAQLQQADLARLQQYLLGQQGMAVGVGQQQAQTEAQRQSTLSRILQGVLGGGLSLASGALTGGLGLGQIFTGGK